jgi:hypothetical protein
MHFVNSSEVWLRTKCTGVEAPRRVVQESDPPDVAVYGSDTRIESTCRPRLDRQIPSTWACGNAVDVGLLPGLVFIGEGHTGCAGVGCEWRCGSIACGVGAPLLEVNTLHILLP